MLQAEQQQEADMRLASKRIRSDQERELKQFREGLKQELRLLKQEVDLLPKDQRKHQFKTRRDSLENDHEQRVSADLFQQGNSILESQVCPLYIFSRSYSVVKNLSGH